MVSLSVWWRRFWFRRASIHNVDMDNRTKIPFKITKHQQGLIMEALVNRGAVKACYRCGHDHHTVHNAIALMQTQTATQTVVSGGPSIPAAIVFCSNCGLLSTYALGVLGLLGRPEFTMEYIR